MSPPSERIYGDMNGDGRFNNNDIQGFVLALINPPMYAQLYPGLPLEKIGDMNQDGALNNNDILPFVQAILGMIPEKTFPISVSGNFGPIQFIAEDTLGLKAQEQVLINVGP